MQKFPDFDLEFLNNIRNKKALLSKRSRVEPVLKDVRAFLKSRRIVLYGGFALNSYLPAKERIYDDCVDIPDYDGYSSNAIKDATDLYDHLVSKGYEILMVKEAMHKGTYSISWEFNSVADITQVDEEFYKLVSKSKQLVKDVYVIDANLLKANAYIELASPDSSMFRWAKVMPRLKKLETHTPITSSAPSTASRPPVQKIPTLANWNLPDVIKQLHLDLWEYSTRNELPVLGNHAMTFYLTKGKSRTDPFTPFRVSCFSMLEVLSKDFQKTMKDIRGILNKSSYKALTYAVYGDNVVVKCNKKRYDVFRVHDMSHICISITKKRNDVIFGSIFYVIYVLYYKLFEFNSVSKNRRNSKTTKDRVDEIKHTIVKLLAQINRNKFILDCYGYFKSNSVIRKERYANKVSQVIKSDR